MKTSKLRVTGLCAGNSPVTGEFPAQMASNAENVFISWRHHEKSDLPSLNNLQGICSERDTNPTNEITVKFQIILDRACCITLILVKS